MKFLRAVVCLVVQGLFFMSCLAQNTKRNQMDLVEDIPSPACMNVIKRAYQMTDLCFMPLDSFVANPNKSYYGGEQYQGMVYSSVKETCQFVGLDVSLHTFMTAMHNPRSVMYTENVSKLPYHGHNCGAYYGTVCSAFVTYALGMKVYEKTYDYPHCRFFELVEDQSSNGVRLADIINSGGHVQLVTGIRRDRKTGKVVDLEICEAVQLGSRKTTITGKGLDRKLRNGKRKIYRYMFLEDAKYEPKTDFVALEGEQLTSFKYNEDICTNRGDKACYVAGDSVILNVFKRYKTLEIYKDSALYRTIRVGVDSDIVVKGLPYGDYKARVVNDNKKSDYTYWKVVDAHVKLDTINKRAYFSSENASPVYLEFSTRSGGRPTSGVFELTEEDVRRGWADVSSYMSRGMKAKARLLKVHFECEYGRVINKPVRWK